MTNIAMLVGNAVLIVALVIAIAAIRRLRHDQEHMIDMLNDEIVKRAALEYQIERLAASGTVAIASNMGVEPVAYRIVPSVVDTMGGGVRLITSQN